MQVEIEVEGLDKSGNFIGYLFIAPAEGARPQNLSELLVNEGLASVHPTAERSSHYNALIAAEQRAKAAKVRFRWKIIRKWGNSVHYVGLLVREVFCCERR